MADVRTFGWLEPPPDESLVRAEQLLQMLGALDCTGALTSRGRQMAGIPGCPTMESLAADGVRGDVFVHELSEVRPGAALDYLGAMQEEWVVGYDFGFGGIKTNFSQGGVNKFQ